MEFIKKYFEEELHPEEKISDAVFLWEINDKSKLFLEEKLLNLKNDWLLEDYEKEYINKQIDYHIKFNNTVDEFENNKNYISSKSKNEIKKLIDEMNSQSLSINEINFLKEKINTSKELLEDRFFWKNIRSLVEESIDVSWELESVISNDKIDKFYELFSLYYINLLESNYNKEEISNIIKNWWKELLIWETLSEKLIQKIIVENYNSMKNFSYKIALNLSWWKIKVINVWNTIKSLEKASSKIYKIELLEKFITWDNSKTVEINKLLWLDIDNNEELLKVYCEYLIESRIVSKSKLLSIFEENQNNFNYLDFLNNYGFTEESENTYKDMIQRELLWTRIWWQNITLDQKYINSNYRAIINNFEVFTKIILEVESSWKNASNNSWSSARWYFQYMTWNNWNNWRAQGKFSSLETALRRYYIEYSWKTNIPNNNLEHHELVPNWIVDFYNSNNLDTRDLTAQQQNDLFIIDLFNNNRTIKNSAWNRVWINDFLWLIAIWNVWWIKNAYKIFHHTSTDSLTDQVLNRVVNKYQKELVKLD